MTKSRSLGFDPAGLMVTVVVHLGVLLLAWMFSLGSQFTIAEKPYIEAGLAFKGDPHSKRQPQDGTSPTAGAENSNRADPDVDPDSVFNKFRKKYQEQGNAQDLGGGGQTDGSPWGTLAEAKGHPYVGDLASVMVHDFTVPSLVSPRSLETLGCVKLDAHGKIVVREVPTSHKSGEPTFDRAVEERLRQTPDTMKPVPEELMELLTKKGICVVYSYSP